MHATLARLGLKSASRASKPSKSAPASRAKPAARTAVPHPFLVEDGSGTWSCRLLASKKAADALVVAQMPPLTPSTSSKANSVENPTIPPAYVCYILRSKQDGKYNNRSYVGSTPDPPRRFRQHNRDIKGGAFRTGMNGPWEMEAFVYGFPSKLSALQFEWAWDKAEKTHWLVAPAEDGEEPPPPPSLKKKSKKAAGKKKALELTDGEKIVEPAAEATKRKAKPKAAVIRLFPKTIATGVPRLVQRFAAMQRLLSTPPFNNYRLSVYLFSADAQKWWKTALKGEFPGGWADKPAKAGSARRFAYEAAKRVGPVDCASISVSIRLSGPDGKRMEREGGVIYGNEQDEGEGPIDVTDKVFADEQWAKWQSLEKDSTQCACCRQDLSLSDHLDTALCTRDGCHAASHLTCLASAFLRDQPSTSTKTLLPTTGSCPSCDGRLHWQDVVRSCWRRHERSTAPVKGKRGKKKQAVIEEEEEEEKWDSSDEEPAALSEAVVEAEEEADRSLMEEMEKEASFDAGYLWQPEEEMPASQMRGEADSLPSSPLAAPKRRRRRSSVASSSDSERPVAAPITISSSPLPSPVKRGRKKIAVETTDDSSDLPSPTPSSIKRKRRLSEPVTPTSDLDRRVDALELSSASPSPAKRKGKKQTVTVIDISD